ncbi:hypothetical protein L1987_29015 [Smallanthus sonchifolius]|uniref:Uncharacterized protein n=1 Tax=Smallanthus sonchifolius TaxID=185202 RepID=A0ACB9I0M0_9ASTR|nr:hypothetical protein L1987_29015 [Smallanthus sonchifolius]
MPSSGGFAVSRSDAGDHIGGYSNVNPDLNQVLQKHQLRRQNHQHQLQEMAVADADEFNAALSIPPFLSSSSFSGASTPPNNVSNLESFLDSVTPIVPAQNSSEVNSSGKVSREADIHPYYCIGDLWETFQEWSAYGLYNIILWHKTRGVAKENDVESHEPNPRTSSVLDASSAALNLNHQKLKQVLLDNKTEVCGSRGTLTFEFMEQEQPHTRKSLADKFIYSLASVLVSQFPELSKYRSCDLSPSSWICVAWYPIYRIPVGPTLKDLEASFLTLHSLSTQPGSFSGSEFSSRNAHGVHGTSDPSSGVRLPVIGLASYKLKGSIISPRDPQEREQENALLEAANNWLHNLQALLPDYQLFLKRY